MDEASRSIFDGDLYTVKQRLQTFENAHWPYEAGSCTPLKMAEAGFYYCGTNTSPDWVRCFICHHELDGWEDGDVPSKEHQQHSANCPYNNIKDPYKMTVGDVLELEKCAAKMFIKKEVAKFRSDAQEYYEGVLEALHIALNQMTKDH